MKVVSQPHFSEAMFSFINDLGSRFEPTGDAQRRTTRDRGRSISVEVFCFTGKLMEDRNSWPLMERQFCFFLLLLNYSNLEENISTTTDKLKSVESIISWSIETFSECMESDQCINLHASTSPASLRPSEKWELHHSPKKALVVHSLLFLRVGTKIEKQIDLESTWPSFSFFSVVSILLFGTVFEVKFHTTGKCLNFLPEKQNSISRLASWTCWKTNPDSFANLSLVVWLSAWNSWTPRLVNNRRKLTYHLKINGWKDDSFPLKWSQFLGGMSIFRRGFINPTQPTTSSVHFAHPFKGLGGECYTYFTLMFGRLDSEGERIGGKGSTKCQFFF